MKYDDSGSKHGRVVENIKFEPKILSVSSIVRLILCIEIPKTTITKPLKHGSHRISHENGAYLVAMQCSSDVVER